MQTVLNYTLLVDQK